MKNSKKYSDQLAEWLVEFGYTHCFFVAGGNVMHLLNSVRTRMTCIPFVHEVGATIAAEYFNASRYEGSGKAFALVTAGPGLTNSITGIAGAWQESRELLIIGGQVKTTDLSRGQVRQRGIQEIDGVGLVKSITKESIALTEPFSRQDWQFLVELSSKPRMGPVFVEISLDVQAAPVKNELNNHLNVKNTDPNFSSDLTEFFALLNKSDRPIFLVGGGVQKEDADKIVHFCEKNLIPIMTTWNGADRIDNFHELYFGRPNTWGQRYSNVLLQQCDLLLAIGTRLGLQQTGFNWREFAPCAKIAQVDIDKAELDKGHPKVDLKINFDSKLFIDELEKFDGINSVTHLDWIEFCNQVKIKLPLIEQNYCSPGFVDPYFFWNTLHEYLPDEAIIVPSSSGGTFTTAYQAVNVTRNQKMISNKSLASMGYGLPGAIGAALANPNKTVVLGEGDGGFLQNIQELGTVQVNNLNLKIFIFDNDGYASIRMTQKNYFDGAWIGCDSTTGLGLPNWSLLAKTYGLEFFELSSSDLYSESMKEIFYFSRKAALIRVIADPNQTFFPKISSRVNDDGNMESNPLHLMTPDLSQSVSDEVFKFL